MLHVRKSWWRNRWHVYDVDTGGTRWIATFLNADDAEDWIVWQYQHC